MVARRESCVLVASEEHSVGTLIANASSFSGSVNGSDFCNGTATENISPGISIQPTGLRQPEVTLINSKVEGNASSPLSLLPITPLAASSNSSEALPGCPSPNRSGPRDVSRTLSQSAYETG
ncbi:unnamed protein product [Protopolystoma xenopodis]|uniref:Uncharacterized protein n=1 Tax=Protopolystoma xenopodis TaxID=117903 RepID=A0A448WYX8_9PLAT|nr:unnamed protein product [Protopolystoma xenopodis]